MSKVSVYSQRLQLRHTTYPIVRDADKVGEYYKKVFGATETVRMNGPDGKVGHAGVKDRQLARLPVLADEKSRHGDKDTRALPL